MSRLRETVRTYLPPVKVQICEFFNAAPVGLIDERFGNNDVKRAAMRECGECTACCEGWLPNKQLDMYAGKACAHCRSEGCAIYETRPEEPCRTFKCAWLQDEEAFPEEMRPDQCGAIVLSARNWREWRVVRAVPAGETIPEDTLEWLRLHTKARDVPLIFYERKVIEGEYHESSQKAFGSQDFAAAIQQIIMRGESLEETMLTGEDVIKF